MKSVMLRIAIWMSMVSAAFAVHAEGLKAVVDLDTGQVVADAQPGECIQRCIEIYDLGNRHLLILHDRHGKVSSRVTEDLPVKKVSGANAVFPTIAGNTTRTAIYANVDEPVGGTCGAVKVNCVEIIYLPDGSYIIIEYNPDGSIKMWDHYPSSQQQ